MLWASDAIAAFYDGPAYDLALEENLSWICEQAFLPFYQKKKATVKAALFNALEIGIYKAATPVA